MDVLGSTISLYNPPQNDNNNLKEVVTSATSISKYEKKAWKDLMPQIIATFISAAFHMGNGISLAYSAVLIAQLAEKGSEIVASPSEKPWIASVLIIAAPPASFIGGFLIDFLGRINTIKIAGIPGTIGWITIALASNVSTIIIGRLFVGIASAWGTNPAVVYITEIANTDIRGPLMNVPPIFVSLGMLLTYFAGWLIPWRTLAWISNLSTIVPCLLCFLIPESPSWLVLKGKDNEAKKALAWIYRDQEKMGSQNKTLAELKFDQLKKEQEKKNEEQKEQKKNCMVTLREFLKPTAYKPLILFIGLFVFQHFSGIYIMMFYSIHFIQEAKTTMNPYLVSIFIAIVRLVMSVIVTYLLKRSNKRTLMFASGTGMALCIFTSGLYTKWIQEDTTNLTIMPVIGLLLYVVFSTLGFLPIPLMLVSELYPLEIRGMAYSITYSINCCIMFAALQSYFDLNAFFGGAKLQWFFALMCCGGIVYSYIFMPETRGRKLTDINKYFERRFIYIGGEDVLPKEEEMERLRSDDDRK